MKFMIASDIHGSAHYCRKLVAAFEKEKADRMILLGDLLYHGPRNALPEEYDPQAVACMLNKLKDSLLCVRGNCDAEIDQMILSFPMMADYAMMPVGDKLMFITHGHLYNKQQLPPMQKGDLLLNGHFHVPACEELGDYTYLNPGSVSIPKEDSWHGYMTLEDGKFQWKDLDGNIQKEYQA